MDSLPDAQISHVSLDGEPGAKRVKLNNPEINGYVYIIILACISLSFCHYSMHILFKKRIVTEVRTRV